MPFYKYAKRYAGQFLKNVLLRNRLEFLIFFISSRCNCRCGICFYWKELNRNNELTLEEIKKISSHLGEFRTLLLSGGEPFLRKDLLDACRLFIEVNKICTLAIPTNGTDPEGIAEFAQNLLNDYPALNLSIAVSLDGFKETHDKIREREGVFDKATQTLNRLSGLKELYKNLDLVVNTVVTNRNFKELEPFMEFIFKNYNLDYHDFELLRGDYKDANFSLPAKDEIKYIHQAILKNRQRYLKRSRSSVLERFAVISFLAMVQKAKERFLAKKRPSFRCSAGENIAVIEANGDVKLCELLPKVGNLKDVNYDFSLIWKSPEAIKLRKEILRDNCSCTHNCFIKLSASSNFKTLFYLVFDYLIYRMKK